MYLFIFICYAVLLGIMLLIPSVFSRAVTALLVTAALLVSLGGYWILNLFGWLPGVMLMLAAVTLVSLLVSWFLAGRERNEEGESA
ncbi:hypothetical protein [Alkalicoccus luteus]|nr:hypothetical protein [Alkalicoccus luteus]